MVTGILCAGVALALALLVTILRRLGQLPSAVWRKMREERDAATPKALDAMREEVGVRVGTSVLALRQYEEHVAESVRALVADAEVRARVGERRADEVADVLGEARALVRELREAHDVALELAARRVLWLKRPSTPEPPASDPQAPAGGEEGSP